MHGKNCGLVIFLPQQRGTLKPYNYATLKLLFRIKVNSLVKICLFSLSKEVLSPVYIYATSGLLYDIAYVVCICTQSISVMN